MHVIKRLKCSNATVRSTASINNIGMKNRTWLPSVWMMLTVHYVFVREHVPACLVQWVCLWLWASVFVCGERLVAPAAVLLSSTMRRMIKGPGGQPIGFAVITFKRWNNWLRAGGR